MPSGAMQLIINLERDELRSYRGAGGADVQRTGGAVLCGLFDHHYGIDTAQQRRATGVIFRPGGVHPFLRGSATEARGRHVELERLWGRGGASLRERLLGLGSVAAIFAALEAALLEQVVGRLERDPVVDHAIAALEQGIAVREVTARLEMTPRRFIRRFGDVVGLTPKRFARIRRFQRVLASLEAGRAGGAEIASACGYADQAHLIHESRALAGCSLTVLRERLLAGRGHPRVGD